MQTQSVTLVRQPKATVLHRYRVRLGAGQATVTSTKVLRETSDSARVRGKGVVLEDPERTARWRIGDAVQDHCQRSTSATPLYLGIGALRHSP
jgi:hypothetical protein